MSDEGPGADIPIQRLEADAVCEQCGTVNPEDTLLCKKCGTVINVFLNDRNARCCNQLMVPLIEDSITEAENN